uniref:EF-hand family protein n=1 Tax=Coptotermes formosanus TaxID=36987 RepID=R4UML3_COPFO|nr:EF-hand family protein [Coptotermes formosanus]
MDQAILDEYSKKFDEHDKDHSDAIDIDEFLHLYRDVENDPSKTMEEAVIIFNGIDINNDKTISKKEFLDLVTGIRNDDKLFMYKMFFRSFDPDRSRSLEAEEIATYFTFCGHNTNTQQAERLIKKYNPDGKKDSLTFAQLFKELTNTDIDPDTDPYDGQIPWPKEEEDQVDQVVSRAVELDLEGGLQEGEGDKPEEVPVQKEAPSQEKEPTTREASPAEKVEKKDAPADGQQLKIIGGILLVLLILYLLLRKS